MSFLRPPIDPLQRILVLGVYGVVLIAATWVAYGLLTLRCQRFMNVNLGRLALGVGVKLGVLAAGQFSVC